ncbi:FAD-dependent oxidoreductase [Dyadobacter luticola]|uniref:FAD-dependent oxidoreductase n=1 Tax=Dyadobacter luticola TaxID=1979387 RepID=A0A5R9KZG9_9BACT|nr:FAD-dependent oxidoreductase [Dyadobacter luticola]TLV01495.1 FAD-dependent oxidoreductase [Dyadobacter luticola]
MNAEPNEITRDGENKSLWQRNVKDETISASPDNAKIYDALIVGAGITGLTTALLLQKSGLKCVVADAHHAGYGTTGGTSAHINTFADTTFKEVEDAFDEESARLFAESIGKSVKLIHELVETYHIDCDFDWKKGYVYAETDDEVKQLDDILESSLNVGVEVKITTQAPARVAYQKALVFENQAQFHPLKYILGLQKEFIRLGGIVLENTLINDIERGEGINIAKSENGEIKALSVVYATHIPPGGINLLHFENAPYRSYVIAATLTDDAYPDDLVYDMKDPYHYFRTHVIDGQKYLVAGGHDHKTGHGDPEKALSDLIEFTKSCYNVAEVTEQWSSQYFVPADGVPYIGKLPGDSKSVYAATGFNGNGMILGTVSAMVISDLILKKTSLYEKLYDPGRIKPVAGFTEFVKESADVTARFIGDRFKTEKVDSLNQLPVGTGEIVTYEGQKLAVYKDESGKVHALDPVCKHAGCIVKWNNSEKSWDCPCHGARYNAEGQVLTGPARVDLDKVSLTAEAE